jgi:hypothetical protein
MAATVILLLQHRKACKSPLAPKQDMGAYPICQQDVLGETLEQLLGDDGRKAYDRTVELVRTATLSAIPERRSYAQMQLAQLFDTDVALAQLIEDGTIYAYVRFPGEPRYIFVKSFPQNSLFADPAPTAAERRCWRKLAKQYCIDHSEQTFSPEAC